MNRPRLSPKMRSAWLLLISLLSCFLFACSAKGGGRAQKDRRFQRLTKRCPRAPQPAEAWLTAVGFGTNRESAQREAKAELSRQISSEIHSQLSVRSREQSSGREGARHEEEVREEITILTRFAHGTLIRPIKRCEICLERTREQSHCLSWVGLKKSEAAEKIRGEVQSASRVLESSLSRLESSPSLPTARQAWRRIMQSYPRWHAAQPQLIVLGGQSEEERALERRLGEAQRAREARLGALRVYLAPFNFSDRASPQESERLLGAQRGGAPSAVHRQLSAQLRAALTELISGVGLQLGREKRCPSARSAALVPEGVWLQPKLSLSCKLGPVGPVCQLAGELSAGLCPAQGRVLTRAAIGGRALTGVHPSRVEVARQRLLERLQSAARPQLRAAILSLLTPLLPMPQLL